MPLSPQFRSRRAPTGAAGSLMDHLAAADAFARLSGQAARLRHLQNQLEAALPAHLLPGTRVANLKRGKIIIHAASGAVAVKVRQLAARLAEIFSQSGQEVTSIEVRVQARSATLSGRARNAPKVLGRRSRLALASLAEGLDAASPLRRALDRLLKNAR